MSDTVRRDCLADELSALQEDEISGRVDPQVAEMTRQRLTQLLEATGIVSRFAILESVDPAAADKCAAAAADAAKAPPFPVRTCELTYEQVFSLGDGFVAATGAIAFARVGSVSLVAMPDPSNRRLREEVSGRLGECRFFRCRVADAQTLVERALEDRRKGGAA